MLTDDEIYDLWAKWGDLIDVDWDFPLANLERNKWLACVRYPDRSIKKLYYGNSLIDPFIRNLIFDLNKNGFWTYGCCQGRIKMRQFDIENHGNDAFAEFGRHSQEAYIGFENPIPESIKLKLIKMGLVIYDAHGKDNGLASMKSIGWKTRPDKPNHSYEDLTLEEKELVLNNNLRFEKCVREAFGV